MPSESPIADRQIRQASGGSGSTERVLLIIADISGYTRYMTANAKSLAHSHVVIGELVAAIIHAVELPLEVAKLEGDAVFLFCRKGFEPSIWEESGRLVAAKLMEFFETFAAKVSELSGSTHCTCNACAHIEKLRLKIIVHSGEALFHKIANFLELAGVDVILVHRLLKNSVNADQYLLLTETAYQDLPFPKHWHFCAGEENYDGIGAVRTFVHAHGAQFDQSDIGPRAAKKTLSDGERNSDSVGPRAVPARSVFPCLPLRTRLYRNWRLYWKLWLAPLSVHHKPQFRHVSSNVALRRRFGLAFISILLAPLILPVGALFVLGHSLKRPGSTA